MSIRKNHDSQAVPRNLGGAPLYFPTSAHAWFIRIFVGLVIGLCGTLEGMPLITIPIMLVATTAVSLSLRYLCALDDTHGLIRLVSRTRQLPNAARFLIIAFFITTVFAVELRYDPVPNHYGFLELLIPIVLATYFFDLRGGICSALLIIAFAFQTLAPPRFAPVLEPQVSYLASLVAFAVTTLIVSFFVALLSRRPSGQTLGSDDLQNLHQKIGQTKSTASAATTHAKILWQESLRPALLFILAYAIFWSIFATVSSGSGVHADALEAYAWGREFALGYYKHPPFWSWVAALWFSIFPKTDFFFYLLSQINGALGLLGAWALIGRFADRRVQIIGTLLLMLMPFYQFNAQRFNANTIFLSLWPWTLYFFIRSVETRHIRYAIACGCLAGLALLSKYYAIILVATCFFAAITHDSRRDYFRSAIPYVTAGVALLIFLPHLVWLVKDGFQPLLYLADRIDQSDRIIANKYFEFIFGNSLYFILPAAVLIFTRWRGGTEKTPLNLGQNLGSSFFFVVSICPFVLTLVASTIGHTTLGIPFAVGIFALVPLIILSAINPPLDLAIRYAKTAVGLIALACLAAAYFLPWYYLKYDPKNHSMPRDETADIAMKLWSEETGLRLRYVGGDRDYAMAVTFRSRDDVTEFNNFIFKWTPWVTREKLREFGLLGICQTQDQSCNDHARRFLTSNSKIIEKTIKRQKWNAEGKPFALNIYIIPPDTAP